MTDTQTAAGEAVHDMKIVTFALGDQFFGIDMRALIEIREWSAPTPLPGVPSFILGVSNLRGNVIPIVGLSDRLGWPASVIHPRSCVLVVALSGKQAGFLVDEVNDIVSIDQSTIQPAPDVEVQESGVIAGLAPVPDRSGDKDAPAQMVMLLDLDALAVTRSFDLAA